MAVNNYKPLPPMEDQCSEHTASTPNIHEGQWLIQIKHGMHVQNSLARPSTVSIFTVPNILLDLKRDAYLPRAVSIGPCFHRHSHLSNMDTHKLRALHRMINRLHGRSDINFLLKEMEKMEGEIRDSYEKVIDCNSETLAWMMVLDASFLLELFRTLTGANDIISPSDSTYFEPIFDQNRIQSVGFAALADIVKLENQIPLSVLAKMMQTEATSEEKAHEILFQLVVKAAATFFPFKFIQRDHWSHFELDSLSVGRKHFLGFLHGLILSYLSGLPKTGSEPPSSSRNLWNHVLPSASRLCKGGIRARPYKGEGRMALRFDKETSTLFLPILIISEKTETVLRNLMALEAFLPAEMQMVSCYVGLMNSMIYTENDVTMLRMAGLLYIYVGNDAQVAQWWGNLCKGMAISSIKPLRSIKKEIMECYRSKFRAKFIEFVLTYSTGSWRTAISLVAATFIFLFTLGQTLSSMYGFSKGSP